MKSWNVSLVLFLIAAGVAPTAFGEPVTAAVDQATLLKSSDPQIAANKQLVYDFWRTILIGGHLDQADRFLAEDYIQHNPNVPTGRKGFVEFFGKFAKPIPVPEAIDGLVSLVGEGDLVVLSFVRQLPDPQDKGKTYASTWFDMFRIRNGKIVEHWDSSTKQ